MENTQKVVFVSAISDDEQILKFQIDDEIMLECKKFDVVFENKISHYHTIDGGVKNSILGFLPMKIKIKGTINLQDNNALENVNALAKKNMPFDLNIGGQNFSNVLLKKALCKVDSFGVSAECELEFEEIFLEGNYE